MNRDKLNFKEIFFPLIIISIVFYQNLIAKDESMLFFSLSNPNNPMQVSMILTDPYNRKAGSNLNTGLLLKEIPNCNMSSSYISNDETGEPSTSGSMGISIIKSVTSGLYNLQIFGSNDTVYTLLIGGRNANYNRLPKTSFKAYITAETSTQFNFFFDPTPGAPPPVLTKVVTFQTIKEDIEVAYKLNQIGDDKFTKSLLSMINIAEKLYNKCEKMKDKDKLKKQCYRPVVAILRMMMKRLEVINKLCDNKTECKSKCKVMTECDEDEVFKGFDNKYRKDIEFKDFFSEWDKDEYHKHKKTCKRYVSDEALEIIATDINWFIKGFGEEVWNDYKKEHNPYIPEKYKQFFK